MAFETIRSASGVDFIGTDEADVLVAFNETGAIFANGRKANDTITFNQFVTGVLSTATVYGGEGVDAINVNGAVANSTINGNKGNDTLTANNLAQTFFDGGADDDTLNANFGAANSTIRGSKGNDIINLTSTIASSLINGNENNDTINIQTTALTSTVVYGGADSDTISDANGASYTSSTINGNKGLDKITLNGGTASGLTVFGGEGTDTILITNDYKTIADNTKSAALYLSGDIGNDNINSVASAGDNTIVGGDGNDTVNAGAGKDTITGGDGDDTLDAGGGTNRVIGGNGADVLTSGGTDSFIIEAVSNSAATVSGKVQGFDTFGAGVDFTTTAVDKLDISAVASSLAGGTLANKTVNVNAIAAQNVADFAGLKANLDALGVAASSTAQLQAYTFDATIDGVFGQYLWINDNQSAYNQGDLMFNIAPGAVGAGAGIIA